MPGILRATMSASATIRRWFCRCCASLAIIGVLAAQEKPAGDAPPAAAAPLPQERETLALGAKELGAFAALAAKSGFPARARQAWLEVIGEYAPDDEAARKALGWRRHGSVWQRDPAFEPAETDRLDVAAARTLEQRWQAVAGKLGAAHRTLAEQLAAAGAAERSRHHAQRALRFTPDDAKAHAAAGVRELEGIHGDEVDLAVLERSRRMARTIARLAEQSFPAPPADAKLPLLDQAGVAYGAVRSEHFTVFGDHATDTLQRAAAWAERALAFCKEAFAGYDGFPPRGEPSTKLVFLRDKAKWAEVVQKSGVDRAEWLVANVQAVELQGVETAAAPDEPLVLDLAVRWVAQDYSGLSADALEEGIGHAVVGLCFGRNLVYSLGQQDDQHTVAGKREQKKLLLPDLATWTELAIDVAWQHDATSAARLPLLSAAEFPTDARIKAWSFCDYLLRRDPSLLRHLQRTASKARTEGDVHEAFQQSAGQSLRHVEDRWRRLWTEDSPLRRVVLGDPTPLETASRDAPAWLELWNRLRQQHGLPACGWSAAMSAPCRDHVDYLKANKDQRGPDAEHVQLAGRPGHHDAGRTFAIGAIVWTKDAKRAADTWLLLPGYRDAIVDADLTTVGVYADGGVVAIDGVRGRERKNVVPTRPWPKSPSGGRAEAQVPAAVDVELFGSELQALLAANGAGKPKQIGCPLTLHGYDADLRDVACKVTCQGEPVRGVLVGPRRASRRTTAPGLWVFWPFAPWRRGAEVQVAWTWHSGKETVAFVAQ
jgi:hypothetical protein